MHTMYNIRFFGGPSFEQHMATDFFSFLLTEFIYIRANRSFDCNIIDHQMEYFHRNEKQS